jgi:hypothetical protein
MTVSSYGALCQKVINDFTVLLFTNSIPNTFYAAHLFKLSIFSPNSNFSIQSTHQLHHSSRPSQCSSSGSARAVLRPALGAFYTQQMCAEFGSAATQHTHRHHNRIHRAAANAGAGKAARPGVRAVLMTFAAPFECWRLESNGLKVQQTQQAVTEDGRKVAWEKLVSCEKDMHNFAVMIGI